MGSATTIYSYGHNGRCGLSWSYPIQGNNWQRHVSFRTMVGRWGTANKLQPRVLTDQWMQQLLKFVASTHRQVAVALKANVQKMNKR